MRSAGAFLACLVVLSTPLLASGVREVAPDDPDVAAIKRMYQARAARIQEHGARGYADAFSEAGVLLPPRAAPVVGRLAIEEWAEEFFSTYSVRFEITSEEITVSGEIGVRYFTTSGTYTERSSGRRTEFDQKYLDVLQRQSDGSWRISHHIWSSNNDLPGIWD